MRKVVRLTERDLTRIVKRVIKEQGEFESSIDCEKFMKDMKRSFNNTKDEFDFYYMNNNEWDRMSPRTASEFLESKLNKIINSAQREGCENIEELENSKNEYLNFWKKY